MRRLIALSLMSAFLLSACGVRGGLERPPPLWGDKNKAPVDKTTTTSTDDTPKEFENVPDLGRDF